MALSPAFELKLAHDVREGLVTVGKFDGVHPSLAWATSGGKVAVHAPHAGPEVSQTTLLAPNVNLTALTVGPLVVDEEDEGGTGRVRDVLVMGTQTLLMLYDIPKNADVLYKEVEDGVFTAVVGLPPSAPVEGEHRIPLVYVGGNCSLQGFDVLGNEAYWTVTGDNVTAVELCDVEGDGIPELLVGSEDYEIRIYKDDEVISEITESAEIVTLTAMVEFVYAFALQDGSIGVYRRTTRLWRESTGLRPTAQAAFDIDKDGNAEVVTGFGDGTIQVRRQDTGELIYSEKMGESIAAILVADYRMEGEPQLIVVTVHGVVKAFRAEDVHGEGARALAALRGEPVPAAGKSGGGDGAEPSHPVFGEGVDEDGSDMAGASGDRTAGLGPGSPAGGRGGTTGAPSPSVPNAAAARAAAILGQDKLQARLDELLAEKHQLTHQLQATTSNLARVKGTTRPELDEGLVPTDTTVTARLFPHYAGNAVNVVLESNNNTVVVSAILRAEHLFDNETLFVHPDEPAGRLDVPVLPRRNVEQDIEITVLVGYRGASFFQTFKHTIKFPRFATYLPVDKGAVEIPNAGIVCRFTEQPARLYAWLRSRFVFDGLNVEASNLDIAFSALRTGQIIGLQYFADRGLLHLKSFDMDFLGELVQDLGQFLGLANLESQAEFPDMMAAFEKTLASVKAFHATRQKLSTDMAESTNLAKTLVVRAEDARILGDMAAMKSHYIALASINRDLMTEFTKRKNNHDALLSQLRSVHQMIQRAAKLRRGEPAKRVIAACRKALAESNMPALIRAICAGS